MMISISSCSGILVSNGCTWTKTITITNDDLGSMSRHLKEQVAAHNIEWEKNCKKG